MSRSGQKNTVVIGGLLYVSPRGGDLWFVGMGYPPGLVQMTLGLLQEGTSQ